MHLTDPNFHQFIRHELVILRICLCYATIRNCGFPDQFMVKLFRQFFATLLIALMTAAIAAAQTRPPRAARAKPEPTPARAKTPQKPTTAEQVAELAIFVYSGGRGTLDEIRKTTSEHGRTILTAADGHTDQSNYKRFIIRGGSLDKDKIRLDQELPTATYSLLFNEDKTVVIYKNAVYAAREDTAKAFENQIFHGLDALLRYQANGSTLALAPNEKVLGVEYYVVDLTDKQGRKTRYYVSAKRFLVMMLTYEEDGVKYRRKFYDYNYAQGTQVPFRSVLWADEKQVEETEIGAITFGQKVDEALFKAC